MVDLTSTYSIWKYKRIGNRNSFGGTILVSSDDSNSQLTCIFYPTAPGGVYVFSGIVVYCVVSTVTLHVFC